LKMQQEFQVHWRYEWPMKQRETWHVQNLLSRRKQRKLRRWMREYETLSDMEKVFYICEPEIGETLSEEGEKRLVDLINYQEGSDEISD
jgi:hypothetical protein